MKYKRILLKLSGEALTGDKKNGIDQDFIQDDISTSRHNVLRGIHGDASTYKLVSCLYGAFYLVVVNNNPKSAQYRKWLSFNLILSR